MKSKKKILVTAEARFFGAHLCEALLNQGHHVICGDHFFTGKKENMIVASLSLDFERLCYEGS